MPVEIADCSSLPECSTPCGIVRWPATAPSQESVAGWPSMTVTPAQWSGSGLNNLSTWLRARALPRARSRCAAVQPALSRSAEADRSARCAPDAHILRHERGERKCLSMPFFAGAGGSRRARSFPPKRLREWLSPSATKHFGTDQSSERGIVGRGKALGWWT